ncbi:hypothetical protein ATCC90586_011513 [Pythium insidiosum]|nr:hypothetical protein ATCC90586_011513 [Pythium insidiosum]
MRGFMRAIGGLFRHSPRHGARRSGGMTTLIPIDAEELQLRLPERLVATTASQRESVSADRNDSLDYGSVDRPQFLFFCGTDNSGLFRSNTPFQLQHIDLPAPLSVEPIRAPQISHRFPVFFAPQHPTIGVHADEVERRDRRAVEHHYKAAQLDQILVKQQQRHERRLEGQQLAEQMEWELAQLALADAAQRQDAAARRDELRDAHRLAVDAAQRRDSASRITQHFFDRLAVMAPDAALGCFSLKRAELVRCCLHLMQGLGDPAQIAAYEEELQERLEREERNLQHRIAAFQREERLKLEKLRAVADLKQAYRDEIQRHALNAKQRRAEEKVQRQVVDQQLETQTRRFGATQATRKLERLQIQDQLVQQMQRKQAENASVSLRIDGKSSPVLRTPYWSDEGDERLDCFQRAPSPVNTVAPSPSRPHIHARKTCQWYD